MNLEEAWEAGNGTAQTNFHGMDIIAKYINDNCVDFKFGSKETGYKHIPKSPVWAFSGTLNGLGVSPHNGWEPKKG